MLGNKNIIQLLVILSLASGQGRMNGFGLGHLYSNQGIVSAGNGVTLLSPSFQRGVSLSNPSTWHNLKFTFLSLSYGGNENYLASKTSFNGYSSLSDAALIVPIKSKSSFGLSLRPYSDQRIMLSNLDETAFYAFSDTLNISRAFIRSGGIMDFQLGSSYLLNENLSFGLSFDILFGSSRQNESIDFGGSAIVSSSRMRYVGILNEYFISYSLNPKNTIYGSYLYSLKPLEGILQEKHLFDDTNGNGYHDFTGPFFDFPFPDSVSSLSDIRIEDIHAPSGYKFGANTNLNENNSITFEFGKSMEDGKNTHLIKVPLDNWINSTTSQNVSYNRFSNDLSYRFIDKLSFSIGAKYLSHVLKKPELKISEFGFSFGLGFKFSPVGNKLNLNYYRGSRGFEDFVDKEIVQQIQIGISLADLWFVKRRQK